MAKESGGAPLPPDTPHPRPENYSPRDVERWIEEFKKLFEEKKKNIDPDRTLIIVFCGLLGFAIILSIFLTYLAVSGSSEKVRESLVLAFVGFVGTLVGAASNVVIYIARRRR
jgi:predicted CDP-diglyceride synthetase/phosphatidate cytidylyltransferase